MYNVPYMDSNKATITTQNGIRFSKMFMHTHRPPTPTNSFEFGFHHSLYKITIKSNAISLQYFAGNFHRPFPNA